MSTTIDLVKRLRTMAKTGWNPIGDEAADEIERLRVRVALSPVRWNDLLGTGPERKDDGSENTGRA